MSTIDPNTMLVEGCNQALSINPQNGGLLILDFGQPYYDSTLGMGTRAFDNKFHTLDEIEIAAYAWAFGYADCVPAGGSLTPPMGSLALGIGTSNYLGATNYAHGYAWAGMVIQVDSLIKTTHAVPASVVRAEGASDIELNWNDAASSRDWSDGWTAHGSRGYVNYGDASGCPPAGTCDNGWTANDIGYVTIDATPEIYFAINGHQWQTLDKTWRTAHGFGMGILGPLTQYANDASSLTPHNAWDALWQDLANDAVTRPEADSLWVSTDVTWAN